MVLYSEAKEQTMSQGSRDAVQDRILTQSKQARKRQGHKLSLDLLRKRQRKTITVSPFGTPRWRGLADRNAHGSGIMRPTMSTVGREELLQHKVVRLTSGDEIELLKQRVRTLEQLVEQLVDQQTSSSRPYKTLSEIHSVREDWRRLTGLELTETTTLAASAMIRKDMPSLSLGSHEDEDEHVKPRQPTCSKLYCTQLTVEFKNG